MKEQFPILNNSDIVYLDSAATTQKPQAVIDAITKYYETQNANVHRSAHTLAQQATEVYEGARNAAANFINAQEQEIILTTGTTHGLNILAHTLPITKDSVIVLSELEHHANLVPWQHTGATLKWIPVKNGKVDEDKALKLINEGCDLLAINHLSNVTGSITDIKTLAQAAHEQGALVIVDGAQAAAHLDIDVQDLGVDAYAFSAHKVYGPTGIGALFVQEDLLATLKPFMTGGEMIDEVTKTETTFAHGPARFEPGTPPIAQAAGFSAALQWYQEHKDEAHEESVMQYAYEQLSQLPNVKIISCQNPTAALTFTIDNINTTDIVEYLNTKNVAIRTGHHCTQPLHKQLNISSSARISIAQYTTTEDIDAAITALQEAVDIFGETQ